MYIPCMQMRAHDSGWGNAEEHRAPEQSFFVEWYVASQAGDDRELASYAQVTHGEKGFSVTAIANYLLPRSHG